MPDFPDPLDNPLVDAIRYWPNAGPANVISSGRIRPAGHLLTRDEAARSMAPMVPPQQLPVQSYQLDTPYAPSGIAPRYDIGENEYQRLQSAHPLADDVSRVVAGGLPDQLVSPESVQPAPAPAPVTDANPVLPVGQQTYGKYDPRNMGGVRYAPGPSGYGELGRVQAERAMYTVATAPPGTPQAIAAQADLEDFKARQQAERNHAEAQFRSQQELANQGAEFSEAQRRMIAGIDNQMQLVRSSSQLSTDDKQEALRQLELRKAGIKPEPRHPALQKQQQPSMQAWMAENVHDDPVTGFRTVRQPDGTTHMTKVGPSADERAFQQQQLAADTANARMALAAKIASDVARESYSSGTPVSDEQQAAIVKRRLAVIDAANSQPETARQNPFHPADAAKQPEGVARLSAKIDSLREALRP